MSRSGYRAFLNRKVPPSRQRKESAKKEILKIHDGSKQNYGAPKITKFSVNPARSSANIPSANICAKWASRPNGLSHGPPLPEILILAMNCTISSMNNLTLTAQTLSGILTLPISGLRMALCTLTLSWTYSPERSLPEPLRTRWGYPLSLKPSIRQRLPVRVQSLARSHRNNVNLLLNFYHSFTISLKLQSLF